MKENKHEVVNDFLRKKKSLGRSQVTLKGYSQTLNRFFHDYFPQSVVPIKSADSHN